MMIGVGPVVLVAASVEVASTLEGGFGLGAAAGLAELVIRKPKLS